MEKVHIYYKVYFQTVFERDMTNKVIEASYIIALKIAQQKIPICETLIMPCALKMVNIVLEKN